MRKSMPILSHNSLKLAKLFMHSRKWGDKAVAIMLLVLQVLLPRFFAFFPPPSKNYAAEWADLSRFLRRARRAEALSNWIRKKQLSSQSADELGEREYLFLCALSKSTPPIHLKGKSIRRVGVEKNKPESNWANYTSSSLWLRDQWAERDFISNSPFSHSYTLERFAFPLSQNS